MDLRPVVHARCGRCGRLRHPERQDAAGGCARGKGAFLCASRQRVTLWWWCERQIDSILTSSAPRTVLQVTSGPVVCEMDVVISAHPCVDPPERSRPTVVDH